MILSKCCGSGYGWIQTFVSDDISEETQIKGRTARQGNTGSFSLVINQDELERIGRIIDARQHGRLEEDRQALALDGVPPNHAQLCSDKDLYLGKLRLIQEPSQIVAFSPPFYLSAIEDEVGKNLHCNDFFHQALDQFQWYFRS